MQRHSTPDVLESGSQVAAPDREVSAPVEGRGEGRDGEDRRGRAGVEGGRGALGTVF